MLINRTFLFASNISVLGASWFDEDIIYDAISNQRASLKNLRVAFHKLIHQNNDDQTTKYANLFGRIQIQLIILNWIKRAKLGFMFLSVSDISSCVPGYARAPSQIRQSYFKSWYGHTKDKTIEV
jgi:hypothetical protein